MSLKIGSLCDWRSAVSRYGSACRFTGELEFTDNFTLSGDIGTLHLGAGAEVDGGHHTLTISADPSRTVDPLFDCLGGSIANLTVDANQQSGHHTSPIPPPRTGRTITSALLFRNQSNRLQLLNVSIINGYLTETNTSLFGVSSPYCRFDRCSAINLHLENDGDTIAYAGAFFANNSYDVEFDGCFVDMRMYNDDFQSCGGFVARHTGGTAVIKGSVVIGRVYARYCSGFTGIVDGAKVVISGSYFVGEVGKGAALVGALLNDAEADVSHCFVRAELNPDDASCYATYRMQNSSPKMTLTSCQFSQTVAGWHSNPSYLLVPTVSGSGCMTVDLTNCRFSPTPASGDYAVSGVTVRRS